MLLVCFSILHLSHSQLDVYTYLFASSDSQAGEHKGTLIGYWYTDKWQKKE